MRRNDPNRSLPPGPLARVVAEAPGRAEAVAASLASLGVPAEPTPDLDAALGGGQPVAVVTGADPLRLRAVCDWARGRPMPPPGVILVHPGDLPPEAAPRAYRTLPDTASPRTLANAVMAAARDWAEFARAWPLPCSGPGERELDLVAALVERERGLAIRADRRRALAEAISTRLVARLVPTCQAYVRRLGSARFRAQELEAIAALLAVNETHFWRHAGQFTALMAEVLPRLRGRPVKVWSAGCASGEEAYSLAIACLEVLGPDADVEILATDVHGPSLARARVGRYNDRAVRNLPRPLLDRHLRRTDGAWEIADHVRRLVRFERQDLLTPCAREWARARGPFATVFCRNTLIYFRPESVSEALDLFVSALEPGGALFLGPSETIWPRRPDLAPVRSTGCFYYRRSHIAPAAPPKPEPRRPDPEGRPDLAALYRAGVALLDAEEFAEARQRFDAILEAAPRDPRGLLGRALLLANEGREREALALASAAAAGSGAPAEAHYLCGLLEERNGNDAAALERYGAALDRDPALVMARVSRAWILARRGERGAAEAEAEAALGQRVAAARVPRWMTGGMDPEAVFELLEQAFPGAAGPARRTGSD
ncbi:CheR family methyltransferase [Deferrisoma palaeochoriense]